MIDYLKSIGKCTVCMLPCVILWDILLKEPYFWKGFVIIVSAFILDGFYEHWNHKF